MATPRASPPQASDHILRVLGEKTVYISQLEAENTSLRAELEALQCGEAKQEQTNTIAVNGTSTEEYEALLAKYTALEQSTSSETFEALSTKYNDLAKIHRDLDEKHKKCAPHIAAANRKWRDAKENARQWKEYVNKQLGLKPGSRAHQIAEAANPAPLTPRTLLPEPSNDEHGCMMDLDATPRPLASSDGLPLEPQDGDLPLMTDVPPERPEDSALLHPDQNVARTSSTVSHTMSSQTTDAGSDPMDGLMLPADTHEPSSDTEPIVVSARSLKRKHSTAVTSMPLRVRIKQEENSPERPIEIKSEDFSSPVLVRQRIMREETSDLDAVAEPRMRAVSEDFQRRQGRGLARRVSSLSDSDMLDVPCMQASHENDPRPKAPSTTIAPAAAKTSLRSDLQQTQALRPLSVNIPSPDRRSLATKPPPPLKPRRSDQVAASKVALLSEDGESQNVQHIERNEPTTSRSPQASKKRRLDSLLDAPATHNRQRLVRSHSPESAVRKKGPLTPLSKEAPKRGLGDGLVAVASRVTEVDVTPGRIPSKRFGQNTAIKKERSAQLPIPPLRAKKPSPAKRASPVKREQRISGRPPGIEDSPPPVQPEEEPLRLRPLSALRLEDFKTNPKFTGNDYTFGDKIRGKARNCLPGCTKPDCCGGEFAKAVRMGVFGAQQGTDVEVLESYLGPNWADIFGAVGPEKRQQMREDARVAAMSNKFGKHKRAFERRSTPPGYWRTDMPSTQEVLEDRAQAEIMARQKVEERWREAMRDGGRWKFRDE
ncbi:hypothetical protein LTR56_020288 [Elasticomyces elasticus]|nr:hypothetical protein LTR56_020288 [Elasticomyces elasticus]KAK3644556.1 hypothetical protein LTR22_015154 [Elasticomyces elasticus]KAK4910408.1 hypothetical protein LTR49_020924 [Elasticomyces elasticus]KAK5750073.1 hypothetical protein LTS12_019878 [Elasticomyces elasticus]